MLTSNERMYLGKGAFLYSEVNLQVKVLHNSFKVNLQMKVLQNSSKSWRKEYY